MRTYLVVLDETAEAAIALRFAARRAALTGGRVEILALVAPAEFSQWGGVQAAMEEEARLRAEAMVLQASGAIIEESGVQPAIIVRQGDPVKVVGEILSARDDIAQLVLGAATESGPGPLVTHYAGAGIAALPCPLVIVPGTLDEEALARVS